MGAAGDENVAAGNGGARADAAASASARAAPRKAAAAVGAETLRALVLRAAASAERQQRRRAAGDEDDDDEHEEREPWTPTERAAEEDDGGAAPAAGWALGGVDAGVRGALVRSGLCRGPGACAEIARALAGPQARPPRGTLEMQSHALAETKARLERGGDILDAEIDGDEDEEMAKAIAAFDETIGILCKRTPSSQWDSGPRRVEPRPQALGRPASGPSRDDQGARPTPPRPQPTAPASDGAASLTDLLQRPRDEDEDGFGRLNAPNLKAAAAPGTAPEADAGHRARSRRRPAPAPWARAAPVQLAGDAAAAEDDAGQDAGSGFVSALSKFQTDQTRNGAPFRRPGGGAVRRGGGGMHRPRLEDDDRANGDLGFQSGKPLKRRRGFRPPARIEETQAGANAGPANGSNSGGVGGRRLGGRPGMGASAGGPAFNAGKAIKRALADQQNEGDGSADGLPPEYLEEPRLRGLDPALIERIESEVLQKGDPVTFDDIAGLRFAKENIEEIVVWPLRNPEYYTGLRQLPKGLLLFGPPGTGKTLIGKAIAHEVSATFFSISASSLTSKWIGEGEKTVRALFGVAAVKQPSVVFIDEVDSLLTQRTADENEASRRIKTEFLVQLDGAATSAGERVLVIGATNRPQELDEAARRRFIKRLYIPLPDSLTRTALLRKLLGKNEHSLTDSDITQLCAQTDGYSGADVTNLAREASMGPLRDKMRRRRQFDAAQEEPVSDKLRPICFQDFQVALRSIRASVSQDDLRFYIRWNEEFGTQEYAAPENAASKSSAAFDSTAANA